MKATFRPKDLDSFIWCAMAVYRRVSLEQRHKYCYTDKKAPLQNSPCLTHIFDICDCMLSVVINLGLLITFRQKFHASGTYKMPKIFTLLKKRLEQLQCGWALPGFTLQNVHPRAHRTNIHDCWAPYSGFWYWYSVVFKFLNMAEFVRKCYCDVHHRFAPDKDSVTDKV